MHLIIVASIQTIITLTTCMKLSCGSNSVLFLLHPGSLITVAMVTMFLLNSKLIAGTQVIHTMKESSVFARLLKTQYFLRFLLLNSVQKDHFCWFHCVSVSKFIQFVSQAVNGLINWLAVLSVVSLLVCQSASQLLCQSMD